MKVTELTQISVNWCQFRKFPCVEDEKAFSITSKVLGLIRVYLPRTTFLKPENSLTDVANVVHIRQCSYLQRTVAREHPQSRALDA